jgi:hypothetical protein
MGKARLFEMFEKVNKIKINEGVNDNTYFETLHGVIDYMGKYAQQLGFELDEEAVFFHLGTGGIGYGETKSVNIPLLKDGQPILDKRGKEANRAIHVSIYRMDSGKYELTIYKTW